MTAGRAASGLRFGRPGGPSLPTASSGLVQCQDAPQLYLAVDFGLLTRVRLRKSGANKGNKLQFVDYQQPKQVVGSESVKFNRCHGSFEWFFGPAKKCL